MTIELATTITERRDRITEDVVSADYARRPELLARYGEEGRAFYARDNNYHLAFLAEAVANGEPALFVDYVAWARSMLAAHGVLVEDLVENLKLLKSALERHLPGNAVEAAVAPIDLAIAGLPSLPEAPPPFISPDARHGGLAQAFLDRLLEGERRGAAELVAQAVAAGLPLKELYLDVFQCSQRELGRLWQLNRITVAQEHFCTAATLAIMNQSYRTLLDSPRSGRRLVLCCVEGDLHEMGLRIVADLFELDGWDADYFGANTPTRDLVTTLERAPPDLVAVSATMTYHIDAVRELIRRLRQSSRLAGIPVLVGGRPFLLSDSLWRQVGADAWAVDADDAIAKAATLIGRRPTNG